MAKKRISKFVTLPFSVLVLIAGIYFIKLMIVVIDKIFARLGITNIVIVSLSVIAIAIIFAILLSGSTKKTVSQIFRTKL